MGNKKEYDKGVNQRKVDQGKTNSAEISVMTCDCIWGWEWGAAHQERTWLTMERKNKLGNQSCPVDRDILQFFISFAAVIILSSFNRKSMTLLNYLKSNHVKQSTLYNLHSYERFSLPSSAQAKPSGNKAPTWIPKWASVPVVQLLKASSSTEPNSSCSTAEFWAWGFQRLFAELHDWFASMGFGSRRWKMSTRLFGNSSYLRNLQMLLQTKVVYEYCITTL